MGDDASRSQKNANEDPPESHVNLHADPGRAIHSTAISGDRNSVNSGLSANNNKGTINITMAAADGKKQPPKQGGLNSAGAIATIAGTLLAAGLAWKQCASEPKVSQAVPVHMDQTGAIIDQKTSGPNSPIINNNSGSVNITTPQPDSQPKSTGKPQ